MARVLPALVWSAWCSLPVVLVACFGDDTAIATDAGTTDATSTEASPVADGSGGVCTVFDAGPRDDAAIAAGLALIKPRKCQQCHGDTLSGNNDGVQSPGLAITYPPNLTPDPATGLGCWTDDQIVTAILDGIDNEGQPLCPPMPKWGSVKDCGLDPTSAELVVRYLRSLQPMVNSVPSTDCTPSVDAGDASPTLDAADDGAPDGSDSGDGGVAVDAGEAGEGGPADAADAADATDAGATADAQDATGGD
ncbi:MAG TPA: hypothetical protein VIF09_01920 [Polyangiaceae bacterium]